MNRVLNDVVNVVDGVGDVVVGDEVIVDVVEVVGHCCLDVVDEVLRIDVVDVDQSRFDKTMKLIVVIGMGQFVLLAVGMSLNVFVVVVDVVDVGIEGVEMKMVMVDVDYC
jgi:hypothetical protein